MNLLLFKCTKEKKNTHRYCCKQLCGQVGFSVRMTIWFIIGKVYQCHLTLKKDKPFFSLYRFLYLFVVCMLVVCMRMCGSQEQLAKNHFSPPATSVLRAESRPWLRRGRRALNCWVTSLAPKDKSWGPLNKQKIIYKCDNCAKTLKFGNKDTSSSFW